MVCGTVGEIVLGIMYVVLEHKPGVSSLFHLKCPFSLACLEKALGERRLSKA